MFRNRALLFLAVGSLGLVACGDDTKDTTNNSTNNATNNAATNNATNSATNNATNSGTNNVATNNGTNNGTNLDIELVGTWDNSFGSAEIITATTWNNGFDTSTIELFGNDDNFAVLLSPLDAEFAPDTYSLVEWTEIDADQFYYCIVDFALDSVDEALDSTEVADSSDLDGEGCGGFAWTKMTRQ